MNNRQPYEITIADKLEQMPLPGLKDSIWSRIEVQLDEEMPTGDNGNDGPQKPNGWNFPRIGGILGTFIAVIAIVALLYKNNTNKISNQLEISPDTIIQTETPILQGESPPGKDLPSSPNNENINGNIQEPAKQQVDVVSTPANPIVKISLPNDSTENALPVIPIDLKVSDAPVNVPIPQQSNTDSLRKKPRGIQGITNDDYRLMPKIDSSGKKKAG